MEIENYTDLDILQLEDLRWSFQGGTIGTTFISKEYVTTPYAKYTKWVSCAGIEYTQDFNFDCVDTNQLDKVENLRLTNALG